MSITEKFPVVVLMLSENVGGEIDLVITPGDWNDGFSFNSTKVEEIIASLGSEV